MNVVKRYPATFWLLVIFFAVLVAGQVAAGLRGEDTRSDLGKFQSDQIARNKEFSAQNRASIEASERVICAIGRFVDRPERRQRETGKTYRRRLTEYQAFQAALRGELSCSFVLRQLTPRERRKSLDQVVGLIHGQGAAAEDTVHQKPTTSPEKSPERKRKKKRRPTGGGTGGGGGEQPVVTVPEAQALVCQLDPDLCGSVHDVTGPLCVGQDAAVLAALRDLGICS